MGGQHRWAPAFLAASHHVYFITYYCIFLIWLIKLLLLLFVLIDVTYAQESGTRNCTRNLHNWFLASKRDTSSCMFLVPKTFKTHSTV